MHSQCQAVVQKRYREIRILYETVRTTQIAPFTNQDAMNLPRFPEKSFFKMNSEIIDKRRTEIELWMNHAVKYEILAEHIFNFMNLSYKPTIASNKSINLSDHLLKFIDRINSTANSRMKLIDKFDFVFFSKKPSVSAEDLWRLLQSLIPLCGDDFIGSKALNFISKLTTSDYYRDFSVAITELSKFIPDYLKTMKLNEYLTKKRFGDSQIQAYTICKFLESAMGLEVLLEIVRGM